MTSEEFSLRLARPQTRILFISLLILGLAVYRAVQDGWESSAVLLGLSIIGIVGVILFGFELVAKSENRDPSFSGAVRSLGGFALFFFGCYLMFYEGIWSGRTLLTAFSFSSLLLKVLFVYLGYRVVFWTHFMSSIAAALQEDRIRVEKPSPAAAESTS